jgi:transketolase
MRVTHLLRARGLSFDHLHITTLKPFNDPTVLEVLSTSKGPVITMENHSIIGGLGSAVAEMMAENGISRKLIRHGLKDTYLHGAGRRYLMEYYHLTSEDLLVILEKELKTQFKISKEELGAVNVNLIGNMTEGL